MAELADAVGEARARARVVGVAVDDDHAGVPRDALEVQVGGASGGFLGVEAAGGRLSRIQPCVDSSGSRYHWTRSPT